MEVRRILVRLDTPTRDGEMELAIVTNLPASDASAIAIAELYRKRWTLETLFFELTQMLDGELNTMGYPRAALLGFGIALVSYNLISTTKSAMRAAFGAAKVNEEVSNYYIANEARVIKEGVGRGDRPRRLAAISDPFGRDFDQGSHRVCSQHPAPRFQAPQAGGRRSPCRSAPSIPTALMSQLRGSWCAPGAR